jgi:hypothetical protein
MNGMKRYGHFSLARSSFADRKASCHRTKDASFAADCPRQSRAEFGDAEVADRLGALVAAAPQYPMLFI